jgi:hypothetical protein
VPDYRRTTCRLNKGGCGKSSDEVGPISWRGLCSACGETRTLDNARGLHAMSGPALDQWRHGMAASVGAVLLDELPPRP